MLAIVGALAPLAFSQAVPGIDSLPLMPWPASLKPGTGAVPVATGFTVALSGDGAKDPRVRVAVSRLFVRLARQTGVPLEPKFARAGETAILSIAVEERDHRAPQRLGDDERYSLRAMDNQIKISADRPPGAVRAIETFLQLVQQNKNGATAGVSVPAVTIQDEPRFPWRGLSFDVARHFMPLDEVRRTIDGLTAVKLNVLHLHLSDAEGFRIESKRYPRLTQYGSDGLFYTQLEMRELIGYARDRGVRIVPEFDTPGHAASWLPGYPKLGSRPGKFEISRKFDSSPDLIDPTQESTYRFLDGFIGEMAKLFPDGYFHIGGDEVDPKQWNDNPQIVAFMKKHGLADSKALHAYFNQRILKIVTKHGKHMEGWDEILQPSLPKSILVESWRGQPSLWQGARAGFQGILSAGYYLDLMYPASYHYAIDPMKVPPRAPSNEADAAKPPAADEPKPGTPAGLTAEQAKLILGGEAAMWVELASTENIDSKLWPRVAAIAERFWSPEQVTDVQSMYRRLYVTSSWLEWLGLTHRSNLRLMRQRLAGGAPSGPLDIFASALEPVKGYSRNAETYTMFTPLNRLVDAIPAESDAAREFRDVVDRYLSAPKEQRNSESVRDPLMRWAAAVTAVRPMLEQNSLLSENVPAADRLEALCKTGLAALKNLDGEEKVSSDWTQQANKIAAQYNNKRVGDTLIQIAPAIQRLVDAVR